MLLSFIIFLFSSSAVAVDPAVASAIETLVAARVSASHEIEYRSVPRDLAQLDEHAAFRLVEEPRASYRGMISLGVDVTTRAGGSRRYVVGMKVRTFEPVAVAAALIDRHQQLRPGQIVMQTIETTQMNGTPVTAAHGIEGMRTRQIIAAGNVITQSMIEPLPLVAAGSPVTVSVRKDNVTLTVTGTAKNDGWQGSIIPVEVQAHKQHLKAKVVDTDHVEIIAQ